MHARVVVVMGVSGSGKTTIGEAIASELGWDFAEGDSMHSAANVAKMSAGTPLTDEDRWPWLRRIGSWIDDELAGGRSGLVTCSALKRSYRDVLTDGRARVTFLHLADSQENIAARLTQRHGHFMPPSLLDSQFQTLEPLQPDEPGVTVDISGSPADTVRAALIALGLQDIRPVA